MGFTDVERKLFQRIADICLMNNLSLRYANHVKLIEIYEVNEVTSIDDVCFVNICRCWLDSDIHEETNIESLERIERQVNEYIAKRKARKDCNPNEQNEMKTINFIISHGGRQ